MSHPLGERCQTSSDCIPTNDSCPKKKVSCMQAPGSLHIGLCACDPYTPSTCQTDSDCLPEGFHEEFFQCGLDGVCQPYQCTSLSDCETPDHGACAGHWCRGPGLGACNNSWDCNSWMCDTDKLCVEVDKMDNPSHDKCESLCLEYAKNYGADHDQQCSRWYEDPNAWGSEYRRCLPPRREGTV